MPLVLLKQPTQTCVCGQPITFPEAQVKAVCQTKYCNAVWILGAEGYWSIQSVPYAPSFAKMKKRRQEKYESMMAQRKVVKG